MDRILPRTPAVRQLESELRTCSTEFDRRLKEIATLQAERDSLQHQLTGALESFTGMQASRNALEADRDRLQRLFKEVANSSLAQMADRNTRLRAALQPFASAPEGHRWTLIRTSGREDNPAVSNARAVLAK